MPSLIVRRYCSSASTNARGSNGAPGFMEYRMPGITSCGCASTTWYCSWNACWASFQFTGSRHAYHHSVRSDSTFHASRMVAAGSMHCAQRRGAVVEVDPGAPAPRLALHGDEVDVAGLELVLAEGALLGHVGVLRRPGRSTSRGTGR